MRDETQMLMPQSGPAGDSGGGGNLFVEADPDQEALGSVGAERLVASRCGPPGARRGRGLVVPVGSPSGTVVRTSDGARFTRANGGIGQLSAGLSVKLRRADARAGDLLRRVAARRYGALLAVVVLGVVLISVSWLGLALRDASAAQRAADRDQIVMAATLRRDQARIHALTGQLATSQASAAAVETWRVRAQSAERKLGSARRRRLR
jgi:GTPase involved in cell partitioning and DNA repair